MMAGKKIEKNMAGTGIGRDDPNKTDSEKSETEKFKLMPLKFFRTDIHADKAQAVTNKIGSNVSRFFRKVKFKFASLLKKGGENNEQPLLPYHFHPLKEGSGKKGLKDILPRKPRRLIIFESTGMTLYAAIARRGVLSKPVMGDIVSTIDADPSSAVARVLELLKERTKLPKNCVFITQFALSDIIALPVDPKKKKPAKQMTNMVKWELEELFLSQTEFVDMGSLLQDAGFISMEERKKAELSGRQGDTSVFNAIVDDQAFSSVQTLLEIVSDLSDDLITGCAPFEPTGEETGSFMWMGAGVDNTIRQLWNKAFSKNKLTCAYYFPRLGAANSMIDPPSEGWLFLDVCQDRFALFDCYGQRIEAVSIKTLKHGNVDTGFLKEVVERSIRPGTTHVFISFPPFFKPVFEEFIEFFESKKITVRLAAEGMSEDQEAFSGVYASMAGTAASFFNSGLGVTGLVKIDANDPPPPVWKSSNFWVACLFIIVLCVIAGSETYLNKRADEMEWALELAEMEYKKKLNIKRSLESNFKEAETIQLKYERKANALLEAKHLKDLLERVIIARRNEVPDILEVIGNTITDSIMILGISEEDRRTTIAIQTWSLESSDAQRFAKDVSAALKKWKYHVADTRVTKSSFSGIDGYYADIKLVRRHTSDPAPNGKRKK